jgi:DNA-dependent RNA polymerase auxiliary subunit epsilon
MKIQFADEDNIYGMIETEENPDKIEKLLNEYRKLNEEEYNIDDFIQFLKDNDVDFEQVNIEPDMILHF